jgi:L-seryl-tRNA(Ser) seleniumtransferase
VALTGSPDALHARLRQGQPAVVGRIAANRLLLDLRTVLPHQDVALVTAISAAVPEARQP